MDSGHNTDVKVVDLLIQLENVHIFNGTLFPKVCNEISVKFIFRNVTKCLHENSLTHSFIPILTSVLLTTDVFVFSLCDCEF